MLGLRNLIALTIGSVIFLVPGAVLRHVDGFALAPSAPLGHGRLSLGKWRRWSATPPRFRITGPLPTA